MTEWFSGMLTIASILMCRGLIPLIRLELATGEVAWTRNKSLRLSVALLIYAVGAVSLLAASFIGHLSEIEQPMWFTWSAFALWLCSKTMIISVTGWMRTCLALYTAWSGFCVFAMSHNWWA